METNRLRDKCKRLTALMILCILVFFPFALILVVGNVFAQREETPSVKLAEQISYHELEEKDDVRFLEDRIVLLGEYATNTEYNKRTGYSKETEHHYVVLFVDGNRQGCFAAMEVSQDDPRFSQLAELQESEMTQFDVSGYYRCEMIGKQEDKLVEYYHEVIDASQTEWGDVGKDTGIMLTYRAGTEEEYTEKVKEEKESAFTGFLMGIALFVGSIIGFIYGLVTRRKTKNEIREQQAWESQFICQTEEQRQ